MSSDGKKCEVNRNFAIVSIESKIRTPVNSYDIVVYTDFYYFTSLIMLYND
jgi:hypothetical protein